MKILIIRDKSLDFSYTDCHGIRCPAAINSALSSGFRACGQSVTTITAASPGVAIGQLTEPQDIDLIVISARQNPSWINNNDVATAIVRCQLPVVIVKQNLADADNIGFVTRNLWLAHLVLSEPELVNPKHFRPIVTMANKHNQLRQQQDAPPQLIIVLAEPDVPRAVLAFDPQRRKEPTRPAGGEGQEATLAAILPFRHRVPT